MNQPHDPNRTADVPAAGPDPGRTVDVPASAPPDSLDAGLAAGFGRPAVPRSSLGDLRPVLLKEAEGESAHIVKPKSDAMPAKAYTGDRYRLDGEIARGGMGAVLRGRDVDLGRDLAVKVLLEKHAGCPEVARRFVEEAQIGGQLQHPGVVPVYDIGRFGDRPFFTMKLVKGHTLAAILEGRADAAADRPRLLGVALKVCETLAYAHAKGVIHRDLKPANVMVGAFGEVQVVDWGLAKVLAEGGLADEERAARRHEDEGTQIRTARSAGTAGSHGTETEAGSLLGTPAYMPPEQANGEVASLDRRCDVFGLGAILCEMLTGRPPYVGRSSEEVRRKAANGDLADATARLDACGADAELITLTKRCLCPEAVDRPKDAQEVTDGLSAYLNGVQERLQAAERERAVAVVREAEQRKKRRAQLALAAAVALLLLGGGAFGWWHSQQAADRRLADERAAAEAARLEGERDAERARRQLADARRAAADGARRARNAEAVAGLLGQAGDALKAGDAARAAVVLEAAKKRSTEGGAEADADRLGRLGEDLALVGDLDAVDQFRWAVVENRLPDPAVVAARTREALRRYGADPDAASVDAAAARVAAAVVRERVVSALDRLVRHQKPAGARAQLRRLDADPFRDAVRDAVLDGDQAKVADLAARDEALEQPPGFAAFLGESAVIPVGRRRRLLESAAIRRPADLGLLMALGSTYGQKERVDDQLRWYQAAIAAAPGNVAAHNNLGLALKDKGQMDEAIACFQKAIALDPKVAAAHTNLGLALKAKGQVDDAIACHKKAIEIDPKDAKAHSNLGVALLARGDLDDAIACYQKAIALDPKDALAHNNLGNALKDKGQMEDAIACYKKAIALDPKYDLAHNNLGNALLAKGQVDAAVACLQQAIALDPRYAKAYSNLGVALLAKGQLEDAIACYQKAIALDPKDPQAHYNLGGALAGKGQVDDAIACFQKAIALDPRYAEAHGNLGAVLHGKGQVDDAIACFQKAIALDPKNASAHCNLGHALASRGRFADSLAALQRGHALGTKQRGWRSPSAAWVREAEAKAAWEAKLPAFLEGEFRPGDGKDRLGLAGVCQGKKLYRAATGLYAAAFAADPALAADLQAGHRYNAACGAALAAAGRGEDAARLDDVAKAKLRGQALDWLRADLALWANRLDAGPPAGRAKVQPTLRRWQADANLAGLRDKDALASLPADEQKGLTRLWADVAELLKKADLD